jgi:hypothetical protein
LIRLVSTDEFHIACLYRLIIPDGISFTEMKKREPTPLFGPDSPVIVTRWHRIRSHFRMEAWISSKKDRDGTLNSQKEYRQSRVSQSNTLDSFWRFIEDIDGIAFILRKNFFCSNSLSFSGF